jgi:hypothetical protein
MTKLRDDVRRAFDREQTALGDVGDAPRRLIYNALAARDVPTSHGLQWAAAIAAVLIAAIVIATFALARANSHSQVIPSATPSPKAQASPTPLVNTLNVPDSTPIIIYGDPAKAGQLDGITWDGKLSGKLGAGLPTGVSNPAANLFGSSTDIKDRSGNTLATGTFGAKFFGGTWADDEAHLCRMVPFDTLSATGVATTLQLVSSDGKARDVAKVGVLGQQTGIGVAACSVLSDRAVVVQTSSIGTATQYWVVQLSTGRVLWTHSPRGTTSGVQVSASRDGMYVVENQSAESTIFGPDGKQVAQLGMSVEAFSWDGLLAVTDTGYGTAPVNLISWRDGAVVWSAPAGYGLLQARPEPDGTEMAIWVAPIAQFQQQTPIGDLYVVNALGKVVVHIANTP